MPRMWPSPFVEPANLIAQIAGPGEPPGGAIVSGPTSEARLSWAAGRLSKIAHDIGIAEGTVKVRPAGQCRR